MRQHWLALLITWAEDSLERSDGLGCATFCFLTAKLLLFTFCLWQQNTANENQKIPQQFEITTKHHQWKPNEIKEEQRIFSLLASAKQIYDPHHLTTDNIKMHHVQVELDSAVFLGSCTCILTFFPVPACRFSGLKCKHAHQQKTNVFRGCNKPAFNTVHFHANLFTS